MEKEFAEDQDVERRSHKKQKKQNKTIQKTCIYVQQCITKIGLYVMQDISAQTKKSLEPTTTNKTATTTVAALTASINVLERENRGLFNKGSHSP